MGDVDLSVDVDFSLLKRVAENPYADQFTDVLPSSEEEKEDVQQQEEKQQEEKEGKDGKIGKGESRGAVKCFGPMPQGLFLSAMGIETRLMNLLEQEDINDEQAMALYDSYRRLVDPEQMGRKYKVLACLHTGESDESADKNKEEKEKVTTEVVPPAFEHLEAIPKDYYYDN